MNKPAIGYLVNQHPAVSHSFIRSEIQALEQQGFDIRRYALRGWHGDLVDPLDVPERAKTSYVLKGGAIPIMSALVGVIVRRPANFAKAFHQAWRVSRGSEQGFTRHLIYLAEACLLLKWTSAAGIRHMHAHFGTNSTEVAMLLGKLGGPRYSFTMHGSEEFDAPRAHHLREKIADAAFVIAITSFCRSQLFRWSKVADWKKINVIGCGIGDEFFDQPERPAPQRRFVCVGRLCEQKGQLLIVEACRVLRDRGHSFVLTLAGGGDMQPEIEAAIKEADLGQHVRITGWISNAEVREEILAASALLMPSFAEGLPMAIMESMALKRPPITTYIGGIPELVRNGIEGLLIPAGDALAIADAVERFLKMTDQEIAEMATAGKARVRERHYIHTEAAKIGKLFDKVLETGDSSRR